MEKIIYVYFDWDIETLETKTYTGIEGADKIKAIMKRYREEALPLDIEKVVDYKEGVDGLPKSDVLKFFLKDGSWFAVRPSGTEPKIKFYFGIKGEFHQECREKTENIKAVVFFQKL